MNFLTIHGRSRYPGLYAWLPSGRRIPVRGCVPCCLAASFVLYAWAPCLTFVLLRWPQRTQGPGSLLTRLYACLLCFLAAAAVATPPAGLHPRGLLVAAGRQADGVAEWRAGQGRIPRGAHAVHAAGMAVSAVGRQRCWEGCNAARGSCSGRQADWLLPCPCIAAALLRRLCARRRRWLLQTGHGQRGAPPGASAPLCLARSLRMSCCSRWGPSQRPLAQRRGPTLPSLPGSRWQQSLK